MVLLLFIETSPGSSTRLRITLMRRAAATSLPITPQHPCHVPCTINVYTLCQVLDCSLPDAAHAWAVPDLEPCLSLGKLRRNISRRTLRLFSAVRIRSGIANMLLGYSLQAKFAQMGGLLDVNAGQQEASGTTMIL